MRKLFSLAIAGAVTFLSCVTSILANAKDVTPDYSLWDKFLKYDLCITDYDSLTEEQQELCHFIFDTEQAANDTVICERARRVLKGEYVGKRITLEQLENAYGIWDSTASYSNFGWECYIDCVPDIIQLDGEVDSWESRIPDYGKEESQYWLDDSGETYVSFHQQNDVDDVSRFDIYNKGEDEPIKQIKCIQNTSPYKDYRGMDENSEEYMNRDGLIKKNGGRYYIKSDGTASFVWCDLFRSNPKEAVTEPFAVESEINGCPVTSIERYAFTDSPFTEIIIPDTIEKIYGYAFSNCKYLEKVTLPKNLKYLGKGAFFNCQSLESVTIDCPEITLNDNTFNYCTNLKSAEINVKEIGVQVFPSEIESVKLGDSVEKIGNQAFYYCKNLTEIEIPDSVKYISQCAFSESGIKAITIPPTVEVIGAYPRKESGYKYVAIGDSGVHPLTDEPKCAFDRDCVISGYKGTEAERYAKEWNLEFVPLEAETGDVNIDGKISIADAVSLQRYLLGRYVATGAYYGDLNSDGSLNSLDMVKLRTLILNSEN